MRIVESLLTNELTRPKRALTTVKGIVFHWNGIGGMRVSRVRDEYERNDRRDHLESAHYIVDLDGGIYQCIPDNEIAYHVGSKQRDPESGKIYTDYARTKFGSYAERPELSSPNECTIGIVMCTTDNDGNFTEETLRSHGVSKNYSFKKVLQRHIRNI
ncbi:MAG: N-acetylmuramoyl-L-alanine amidase [Prevotellaceae bacterium]|jgi:N-acetylmuramoyl-L-alanine amidase|nr:N-acetylmuramoyl-L-alanine amidase [Prevotellaceae bacterium]